MSEQEMGNKGRANVLAMVGIIFGILGIIIGIINFLILYYWLESMLWSHFIFSNITGAIFAITACGLGYIAKKQIIEQSSPQSQMKLANAAYILGAIGILINLMIVVSMVMPRLEPIIDREIQDIINNN